MVGMLPVIPGIHCKPRQRHSAEGRGWRSIQHEYPGDEGAEPHICPSARVFFSLLQAQRQRRWWQRASPAQSLSRRSTWSLIWMTRWRPRANAAQPRGARRTPPRARPACGRPCARTCACAQRRDPPLFPPPWAQRCASHVTQHSASHVTLRCASHVTQHCVLLMSASTVNTPMRSATSASC